MVTPRTCALSGIHCHQNHLVCWNFKHRNISYFCVGRQKTQFERSHGSRNTRRSRSKIIPRWRRTGAPPAPSNDARSVKNRTPRKERCFSHPRERFRFLPSREIEMDPTVRKTESRRSCIWTKSAVNRRSVGIPPGTQKAVPLMRNPFRNRWSAFSRIVTEVKFETVNDAIYLSPSPLDLIAAL